MNKEHLITRGVVHSFINNKDSFSLNELEERILREKGTMRVSTGVTVMEYLRGFERAGKIKYSASNNDIQFTIIKT